MEHNAQKRLVVAANRAIVPSGKPETLLEVTPAFCISKKNTSQGVPQHGGVVCVKTVGYEVQDPGGKKRARGFDNGT